MAAEQRFVFSIRIIGAVHRDAPRLRIFMMSVLWTDESEVIIYRSFKEFKKFHRQLKKRFPLLNPLRKSDRVIPKFSGKARSRSLKQKGSQRSVKRMTFLESYCTELLKCEQRVTQSSEVTQFFMPKAHDLDPDFSKNSFMILLSDDQPGGSGGGRWGVAHQNAGSITHPFVTQTYRCVAAYETRDTKNRPFKVDVDEKLEALIKDPTGWWLVESEDRRLAWFPAPYLEQLDGESDEDDEEIPARGHLYCAVRSYSTKNSDEVSVPIGSVVEVLRTSASGWWLVRFQGRAGYVPSMYLRPYSNPRTDFFSIQRKLHSSSLNLTPHPPRAGEDAEPGAGSAGRFRSETGPPARLQRARSLNVLSEPWSQVETRSISSTSAGSSLSDFSSGSDSFSSLKEDEQVRRRPADAVSDSGRGSPPDRRGSDISSSSSGCRSLTDSETASVAPRMPPRPKTEEILTRCTTMTRKAALATRARLHIQAEPIHAR